MDITQRITEIIAELYSDDKTEEDMARAIVSELGLTEERSNDIAGAAWGQHSRWVSKWTFHPGPHHYSKEH